MPTNVEQAIGLFVAFCGVWFAFVGPIMKELKTIKTDLANIRQMLEQARSQDQLESAQSRGSRA